MATIVLFEPQIPQNTGNIVRTCSVTGYSLVLVKPLGFSIDSRYLKRAGLDYWDEVDIKVIDDLEKFLEEQQNPFYFFSSKVERPYSDVSYGSNDIIIFGSETTGLADRFYERWPERFLTIPMIENKRCLNLSNAAAIVVYESWRQRQFN
jgi:tRNA (cytidine/uridine-2'-O-)-methyltransferase